MKSSSISGIAEYGFIFLLGGEEGGLAYFTSPDSLQIFEFIHPSLELVSIAPDNQNDRIYCATGGLSNSDGLYLFDVDTEEWDLLFYSDAGNFVKKLTSGYYFGWGWDTSHGGLIHSADGEEWNAIDYFNGKNVTNVAETGDGTLFVTAGYEIFIEGNEGFSPYMAILRINDIYVRSYPNDSEVYVVLGEGSWSDGVYRVEYGNGEVTDMTFINWLYNPYRLYQYMDYLVVGTHDYNNTSNLFMVEPVEGGEGQLLQVGGGLGIDAVYCFETYPIYTHNIMVGADNGLFLGTNLLITEVDETVIPSAKIELVNHPNPFNPETTIKFFLPEAGLAELTIYDLQGRKVDTLLNCYLERGEHQRVWTGIDGRGSSISSGVYFLQLSLDQRSSVTRKVLLLK